MGDLHDEIVGILVELCREYKKGGRYETVQVYPGPKYHPLLVTFARHRRRPIAENYNPDVWAGYFDGQVDVYEVWHTESESDAIQDLLYSALTTSPRKVRYVAIVCTEENVSKEKARTLADLILNYTRNEKGELLLDPTNNVLIADIPDGIRGDRDAMKKHLTKEFEF